MDEVDELSTHQQMNLTAKTMKEVQFLMMNLTLQTLSLVQCLKFSSQIGENLTGESRICDVSTN